MRARTALARTRNDATTISRRATVGLDLPKALTLPSCRCVLLCLTPRAAAVAAARLALSVALGALPLVGCAQQGRLLVVVDSNIPDLDAVSLRVRRSTALEGESTDFALSRDPLPIRVGLEPVGGTGLVRIEAVGVRGGAPVVESTATVNVLPGPTRVYRIYLDASCEGVLGCAEDETCVRGACESAPVVEAVDLPTLELFDAAVEEPQDVSVLDAGAAGAGCAMPSAHIVFLNRTGGTYLPAAESDAWRNETWLVDRPRTIAPWPYSDANWATTLDCARTVLAPFNAIVVDIDPGSGPHHEIVMGAEHWDTPSLTNLGPWCTPTEDGITFVFGNPLGDDPRSACHVAMRGLGRLLGLDRVESCADVMSLDACGDLRFVDSDLTCTDGTRTVTCCSAGASQNSYATFTRLFGRCPLDTMGLRSCSATYGLLPRYTECRETPTECEFYVGPRAGTLRSCASECESVGGRCLSAFGDMGARCLRVIDGSTCNDAQNGAICVCSRVP